MGIISNLLGTDNIAIGANNIARSNRQLGDDIWRANIQLSNTLQNISDADIKARDRVNITLKEYEDMKDKISSLSYEVNRLRNILERIEAPLDKKIVPNSIRNYWIDDIRDFKRKFIVEFEIEHGDLR